MVFTFAYQLTIDSNQIQQSWSEKRVIRLALSFDPPGPPGLSAWWRRGRWGQATVTATWSLSLQGAGSWKWLPHRCQKMPEQVSRANAYAYSSRNNSLIKLCTVVRAWHEGRLWMDRELCRVPWQRQFQFCFGRQDPWSGLWLVQSAVAKHRAHWTLHKPAESFPRTSECHEANIPGGQSATGGCRTRCRDAYKVLFLL